MTTTCNAALKEWATTCHALGQGRQILLLRKGGILDPEGAFELERPLFWLQPTYEHQHETLVKPADRALFDAAPALRQPGENTKFIVLRWLARVERVWDIRQEDEDLLDRASHMWSDEYLQIRWNFRPEHPLLCAALRVFNLPEPHVLTMRPEFGGCRSWIDLPEGLPTSEAVPALSDEAFAAELAALEVIMQDRKAV